MDQPGFLSLLPALLAILLAIRTKQVFLSLLLGVWIGRLILANWNPLQGSLDTVQALVAVFQDAGNTRTILFCALVGALLLFMQRSGGVQGFVVLLERWMLQAQKRGPNGHRTLVQLLAWLTGVLLFVETSISSLTVGTLFRPAFDQVGISREKLAYIADSSSAPSSILIPINAWGAYIMGLLAAAGHAAPLELMLRAMPYNFYPMLALAIVLVVIFSRRDIGPMAAAERRVRETGELLEPNAQPMVSEELTQVEAKEGVVPRAFNMLLPLGIMVGMMPVMLAYTGWEAALEAQPNASSRALFFSALGQGSGSTSVLVAVLTAIAIAMLSYRVQGIFRLRESTDMVMKGIAGLLPLALLMMLAFAISAVCRNLQTGQYVAELSSQWLSPALLPALVFLISCFIAFATGTSWGTFAIMLSIALPMAESLQAPLPLILAAVLGGGVFGDHCSPISDTSIISSMAAATDHIDHVRTQLPYALIGGGITAVMYLLLGLMNS
jgi:tetracycline resistance efflux pump